MDKLGECGLELAEIRGVDSKVIQFADCAVCGLCEVVSRRSDGSRAAAMNDALVAARKCPLPENMPDEIGVEAAFDAETDALPLLQHD